MLRICGIPPDVLDGMPVVTLTGAKYVKIEHHCGVLLLSDRCIRVYSPMGIIRITGALLQVTAMDNENICIIGRIKSASFEKNTPNEE